MGAGNTAYRVYNTTATTVIDNYSDDAFDIEGLSVIGEYASDAFFVGDDVAITISGSGFTGVTGAGVTGFGISGDTNLIVREVLAGTGAPGRTLDLGRVLGPTGPVGGTFNQYMYQDVDGAATGNTGLQYDATNEIPKLVTYRERVHVIGNQGTSDTLSIDADNGPIQKVSIDVSLDTLTLELASFKPGQGVTVIIEVNGGLSPPQWSSGDSDQYYNAVPTLTSGITTLVYILAYHTDDQTSADKYYITSQTFDTLP